MRSGLTYRATAFVVVLAASVCLAIANAFRAFHAPFTLEIRTVCALCRDAERIFST